MNRHVAFQLRQSAPLAEVCAVLFSDVGKAVSEQTVYNGHRQLLIVSKANVWQKV